MSLTSIFSLFSSPRRRAAQVNRLPLAVEPLEQRQLMAAQILLDFNGASSAEIAYLDQHVRINADLAEGGANKSFVGEFATLQNSYGGYDRYRFLDFNGNGQLTAADGELAVSRILAKVRQDFAPYDVQVLRQDTTFLAINSMNFNLAHDAYVVVSGHHTGAGGQAPLDTGNAHDNGMAVGGSVGIARLVADWEMSDARSRDGFVNIVANLISHEAGHSFGLKHVDVVARPAAISLMTPLVGISDLPFGDGIYPVEGGGTQSAHGYLNTTLGATHQSWAAVLREGTLTVQGGDSGDVISIFARTDGNWDLHVGTQVYFVDPDASPDINSLNPFAGTAIHTVRINGGTGNDFIFAAGVSTAVTVHAFGGEGNDTIFGHAGVDYLYGNEDQDLLVGGAGVDVLYGDSGRDVLIGGRGADRLSGGTGDDLLLGGDTTLTSDLGKLYQLRDGWIGTGTYTVRAAFSELRLNGTMSDEGAVDLLFGQGDMDLFFHGLADTLDAIASEVRRRI